MKNIAIICVSKETYLSYDFIEAMKAHTEIEKQIIIVDTPLTIQGHINNIKSTPIICPKVYEYPNKSGKELRRERRKNKRK